MEQFSQNTYWILAQDLIQPKLQERSPYNWVGWKKKKKKGIGVGPAPLRGSCEREKFHSPWEGPSPAVRWAGTEGELQSLRGEWSSWIVVGRTERDLQRRSWPSHCSPQLEASWWLVSAGPGCWNSSFREQTWGENWAWLHGDSLKGLECGPSHNWGCEQEGALVHHWSPIVKLCAQREGQGQPQQSHSWCAHTGCSSTSTSSGSTQAPSSCTQRQGWNPSGFPGTTWLQKQSWNLSVSAAVWSVDLCTTGSFVNSVPVGHLSGLLQSSMQWQGQGLDWLSSSQGRSRCATMAVPVPDLGLRAVPNTMYFVSPHNGWQVTPWSALPGGQLLQRNTQWLFSQQECSSPAYLILQFRNGSGGVYSTTGEQTLPPTGLWQPQSKDEAPLNIQCRLWSPQQQSYPLIRRITANTHWGKMWQAKLPHKNSPSRPQ